jgi:drug/metabolite transporter (DMT)-like permease
MEHQRPWLSIIGLFFLAWIWGYNWVVMKVALRDIGPFAFAGIRALLGGGLLMVIVFALRRPHTIGSFWGVLLLGLIQTTGFSGIIMWALVSGGAGKTSVLVYTMPMWLLLLAWLFLGERLRGWQWPAVASAFLGLICLVHPWRQSSHFFSTGLAVLAALFWALSGVWNKCLRKRVKVDLLALTAWQLLLGGIPLFLLSLFVDFRPVHWTPYLIGALVYNVMFCSAAAWTLWFFALQELPAGIAGMGTLLTPVVGVMAAWLQLGEAPGIAEAGGMVLVFFGLALLSWVQLRKSRD